MTIFLKLYVFRRMSSLIFISTMNVIIILHLLLFIFIIHVKCQLKEGIKSKNLLPYFRRKVEEVEERDVVETTEVDDPRNLVSFLVKNVREIFDDDVVDSSEQIKEPIAMAGKSKTSKTTKSTIATTIVTLSSPTSTALLRPIIPISTTEANISSSSISTSTTELTLVEILPLTTLIDKKLESTENFGMLVKNDVLHLSKDLNYYFKTDKKEREVPGYASIQPYAVNNTESDTEISDPRRSCIMCDNVISEDCNDPKNKLISSIMCDRDDDLCYSLHTPFGIIDRGCFNVNHNLTTYVCSCNLCNYISISEMPFMFSNKRDWVDNVVELSRTRHFRKSVFKDMSCLRCEVNTTTKTGDMLDSANCLEGNIGNLPVEDCEQDEVCAVRALRADGYIWRGCVKGPLYNYWLTVCDHDLCNYDTILNLYDFVI